MNCTGLTSRTSFPEYIKLLRNATKNDFSLVADCRSDVCGAFWGSGNLDISGVGMAVGYLLESIIAFGILCAFTFLEQQPREHPRLPRLLLATTSRVFYDNAAFFTFAIQTASIVTLTRVDFGISASGMGALTMEIVWLVSTLTLLPLLPLLLKPQIYDNSLGPTSGSSLVVMGQILASHDDPKHNNSHDHHDDETSSTMLAAKQDLRFLLFFICWAMAFCPFFSRMSGTFGVSRIGDTEGSSISTAEWKQIEDVCFEGVSRISTSLENLITASGIISYSLVSITVISSILKTILEDYTARWYVLLKKRMTIAKKWKAQWFTALCVINIALLIVQFWGFFRLRQLQKDVTGTAGGDFGDGEWTFGQIVAVIVFMPVFVEVVFTWRKRALYGV